MPVSAEQTSRTLGLSPVPPPFLTNVRCETRPCFVFFFFYYSEEPRQQRYRDVKITFGWLFCSLFRTMSSHGGRNPQQRACPEANREPRGPTFYFLFLVNSIVWRVRSFVHHLSPSYSINLNISIAEVRVGAVIWPTCPLHRERGVGGGACTKTLCFPPCLFLMIINESLALWTLEGHHLCFFHLYFFIGLFSCLIIWFSPLPHV